MLVLGNRAVYGIFLAMLAALLLALAFGWICARLAARLGLMDVPGSAPHKQHARSTPLAGGMALFAVLWIAAAWLGLLQDHEVLTALTAATPIFLFGLWDDARNIRPVLKLIGQFLAAGWLVYQGMYVKIFESPQILLYSAPRLALALDVLLTLVWVIGITNAFNFVDSMDGLVVGLSGMSAAFFVLLTLNARQETLAQYSAVLLGLCMGLYFYNSPPALLFLGDSGAQTLGFVLAALAISYTPQVYYQASTWFAPILLLGVPIFDTTLVVTSRLRHRRRVYRAGLDHTYHRLSVITGSPTRAVLLMHITSFALGCLAFLALNQAPLTANLLFCGILAAGLAAVVALEWAGDRSHTAMDAGE